MIDQDGKNFLVGKKFDIPVQDGYAGPYKIEIVEPDPSVDYKILLVEPEEGIDFKMSIVNPLNNEVEHVLPDDLDFIIRVEAEK